MTIRCGGARYPNTTYKTTQHCIAYIDLLGGANKICLDKTCEFLNYLNMFMDDVNSEVNYLASNYKEKLLVKIFSDNILYAIEIKENDLEIENKIATLFNLVANLSNEVFRYGYLIRGAIVLGDFFCNKNIVYGEGLVRAVKIEENIAIYPRIIVQKEIESLLPHYCLLDSNDNNFILNTFLSSDSYDYITFKYELLKMLKENKNNESIRKKIMWVINYYNKWFIRPEARAIERPQITQKEIYEIIK